MPRVRFFLKVRGILAVKNKKQGFPDGPAVKNLPANARDVDSVPGLETSPVEANGDPLQYSCLGNPWTEEPGRLRSMGSQRVGYDSATEHKGRGDRNRQTGEGQSSCSHITEIWLLHHGSQREEGDT